MKQYGIIIILLCVFISCKHNPAGPDSGNSAMPSSQIDKNIVQEDNSFGFKLFNKLSGEQLDTNVIISPLSISTAFGMALNGAHGATLDSLEQALGKSGMSLDAINAYYQTTAATLANLDANVNFQIANSIWYRSGFSVLPKFLNDNKTYFDAEVQALNFASADAVATINNWVSTKTNGKIPTILQSIPESAMLYLINAIYFKGNWTYQFNSQFTKDAPFTCNNGTVVACHMMSQESKFAYYADSTLQAIDLPYGNGSFSMTILLPSAGTNIDQFAATLTQSQWNSIVSSMDSTTVDVYLPKFQLNYGKLLGKDLASMGMGIAFSPAADFTHIDSAGGIAISDVLHKTFIEVSEEGTEAAAVTVIIFIATTMSEGGHTNIPPIIRINHSFIFAIRDHQTGTILFIGKVVNPNG
ncbi:MAG TPA: serpin family protein [Bacteroidota bacterium]|nr:serpin family protein [Bacteroidota bacterium]